MLVAENARIVVLGAGISGLWTAHSLLKSNPNIAVTVLEKHHEPGGLFSSSDRCGYHFNHGLFLFPHSSPLITLQPHRFNPVVVSYEKIVNNQLVRFPVDPGEMHQISRISNVPELFCHLVRRSIKNRNSNTPSNLDDWLRLNLPDSWSDLFRIDDYVYKLMGYEPDQLSHEVGLQRLEYIVRMFRLKNISRHLWRKLTLKFRNKSAGKPLSTVSHYTLNSEGTGGFIKEIVHRIQLLSAKINTGVTIQSIDRMDRGFKINLRSRDPIICDKVISTIPVTELAQFRTHKALPSDKLQWRNIGLFFFRLRQSTPEQPIRVIYSFDRNHVWKRVVLRRIDDEFSAVRVEVTTDEPIADQQESIMTEIRGELSRIFNVSSLDDWVEWDAMDVPYGYPCLLKGYESHLAQLTEQILEPGLYSFSRQGMHQYSTSSICANIVEDTVKTILKHGQTKALQS